MNTRIRTEGSNAVVDAALAAGVPRLIQESISFMYPDGGDRWMDETVPIDPPPGIDAVAVAEANANRFTDAGRVGVVLRFGFFYGPGARTPRRSSASPAATSARSPGAPNGYQSSIHLADAASAVVAALDAPAGIYNVVDDEPLTKKEYAQAVGAAVGVKSVDRRAGAPRVARRQEDRRADEVAPGQQREVQGGDRVVTAYPSAREGWQAMEMSRCVTGTRGSCSRSSQSDTSASARGRRWRRARSTTTSPEADITGSRRTGRSTSTSSATSARSTSRSQRSPSPRSLRPSRYLVQVVAGATLVYAAPHFLYHLFHLDVLDTRDKVARGRSLAVTVIAPVLLLIHAWRTNGASPAPPSARREPIVVHHVT